MRVVSQLAPDLDPQLLRSLTAAFGDLRKAFDVRSRPSFSLHRPSANPLRPTPQAGTIAYPFSLRELIALVRHLHAFPSSSLETVLRNVFDFDVSRPETIEVLYTILRRHKLGVDRVGLDAVRAIGEPGEEKKPGVVVEFEPKGSTELSEPKFGKVDDKEHVGGNTWAGGTGGRDTAGLGGRGGYMRLYKGGNISQIPDSLKAQVPPEVQAKAREMAR